MRRYIPARSRLEILVEPDRQPKPGNSEMEELQKPKQFDCALNRILF